MNLGSNLGFNLGSKPGFEPGFKRGLESGFEPGLNPRLNLGLNLGWNLGSEPGFLGCCCSPPPPLSAGPWVVRTWVQPGLGRTVLPCTRLGGRCYASETILSAAIKRLENIHGPHRLRNLLRLFNKPVLHGHVILL